MGTLLRKLACPSLTLGALFVATGCLSRVAAPESGASREGASTANACKLWVQAFSDAATTPQLSPKGARHLTGNYRIISEPACVRRNDGVLVMPDHFVLHTDADHRMCQEGTQESPTTGRHTCSWNLTFRDRYPVSFAFFTEDPNESLAAYLQVVRVYRNGALAYRRTVDESARSLLIVPGEELKASLLPYDAPLDLRLIGRDLDLPPEVTVEEVAKKQSPFVERFHTALSALESSTLGRQLSASRQQVARLVELAQQAELTARCLAPTLVEDAACKAVKDPAVRVLGTDLRAALTSTDAKAAELRSAAEKAVLAKTTQLEHQLRSALLLARAAVASDLAGGAAGAFAPPSDAEIQQFLLGLDALALSSSELVNGTAALVDGLRATAATARDKQTTYELYNHVAKGLASQSVFEPRTENPEPLAGEVVLPMRYSDHFQTFAGSVWTALPTRPDEHFSADLNASIVIPIVDAVGMRWQFGPSRFADLRAAAGFSMFGEEVTKNTSQIDPNDPNAPTEATEKVDAFHLAPQVNVSFATLHLGLAYIVSDGGDLDEGWDRVRMLIGADLVKLVTGRNLEGL